MAQRVQIILDDDLDGGEAAETVTFGLDGVTYEIDLNSKNASKLRDDLATWVGHARRSGGRKTGARSTATKRSATNLSDVREWARKNGHNVSERGRIAAEVQTAYDKAHA